MRMEVDKKSVIYVFIYLSIFFLCAVIGTVWYSYKISHAEETSIEAKPTEIKHSPEYYNIMRDDAQIEEYMDKYIKSLENRIQELEGQLEEPNVNNNRYPLLEK